MDLNPSRRTGPKLRAASGGLFLASIFYGDIWLGITVPVSMLLLPFVFLAYANTHPLARIPAGFWLLLGMSLPVAMQFALGRPLNGKSDAVVYLPIAYALATMFVLRRAELRTDTIWRAFVGGGCVAAGTMVLMMLFVPVTTFLVPGQNYSATQRNYQVAAGQKARDQRNIPAVSGGGASADSMPVPNAALSEAELGLQVSQFERGFYGFKRSVRNGLGQSNYIAAFFVFFFTVSLFHSRWTAATVFALLAIATLSRFGVIFLSLTFALWILHRRGARPIALATGTLALGLTTMVGLLAVVEGMKVPTSVAIRGAYWRKAVTVISAHPLVGAPRSHILETFDLNILWNPHNVLLWVSALVGVIGMVFYAAFLFVALREIHQRATTSLLWAGIFFGFIVMLTWSLFEPIALTPAFELLLAALYTLARNDRVAVPVPEGAAGEPVLAHS